MRHLTKTNKKARRQFIQYACAGCAGVLFTPKLLLAQAAAKNAVHDFQGQLTINKIPATVGQTLKAGDSVITGANSKANIVFNGDAYHLKEKTNFVLPNEQGASASVASGAVLAAFSPGKPKKIQIGEKVVLAIRGTGVYIEVGKEKSNFCLCYGSANLSSDKSNIDVVTDTKFHKDFTILNNGEVRSSYPYERRLNHTSRQNIELEKIVGRPSPFGGSIRKWISQLESPDL
jgi:hypothetical protein